MNPLVIPLAAILALLNIALTRLANLSETVGAFAPGGGAGKVAYRFSFHHNVALIGSHLRMLQAGEVSSTLADDLRCVYAYLERDYAALSWIVPDGEQPPEIGPLLNGYADLLARVRELIAEVEPAAPVLAHPFPEPRGSHR